VSTKRRYISWISVGLCLLGIGTQCLWWVWRILAHPAPPIWAGIAGWGIAALPSALGGLIAIGAISVSMRDTDPVGVTLAAVALAFTACLSGVMMMFALSPF
jgi:hypothetical protein